MSAMAGLSEDERAAFDAIASRLLVAMACGLGAYQ
jgi:hypothetical protein